MSGTHLLATIGAATVLVGGVQLAADAATGHPLLLGRHNTASKTTVVKTSGKHAALSLKTGATVAPLKVKSSAKVAHLNADLVDGKDSSQLGTTTYRYTIPTGEGATRYRLTFPGLPAGTYLATYSVLANGASGLECGFRVDTSTPTVPPVGYSYGAPGRFGETANGTGTIDPNPPGITFVLRCESNAPFTFGASSGTDFNQVSEASFTRIDHITDRSAS